MGFWTDFVEAGKGAVGDFASSAGNYLTSKEGITELGKLGLGYIVDKSGINNPQKAPVGYQGKIPELSAVRDRVVQGVGIFLTPSMHNALAVERPQ
jgi:hypothetical protein